MLTLDAFGQVLTEEIVPIDLLQRGDILKVCYAYYITNM